MRNEEANYEIKLNSSLESAQFFKKAATTDSVILKIDIKI